jgi:aldehyde:ferredoxin oxidoreductase
MACFACPIGCHHVVQVEEGKYKSVDLVTEYETVNSLGARIWNRNLPSVVKGGFLCDDYGLDTISAGCVIAFAMELYEKGVAKPVAEQLVEGEEVMRRRFAVARDKYGDRLLFAGPDCGLGGWPSQESAELLLKRAVAAVRGA